MLLKLLSLSITFLKAVVGTPSMVVKQTVSLDGDAMDMLLEIRTTLRRMDRRFYADRARADGEITTDEGGPGAAIPQHPGEPGAVQYPFPFDRDYRGG